MSVLAASRAGHRPFLVLPWVQLLLISAPISLGAAEHWPEFRGPAGDGSTDAIGLPLRFGETENVAWKTPIHGRGWSTPVIWGTQIWLTTATADGHDMFAIAVDRDSGKVLHDLKLFHNETPEPLGVQVNCYASPSAAIEAGRVFVHFGSYGTACLETPSGKVLWQRRDLPCRHFRGPGSSVILHGDLLILTMDGFDVQYVCALDKATGKTVWKTDRSFAFGDMDGDFRKAYSTPFLARTDSGLQLLSCGAKAAYAYDPNTGRELWRVRYDGFSNAARPLFTQGLALINTGFSKADLWAVRVDGSGDVTDTHIVWRAKHSIPTTPSPVVSGDHIYQIADSGIASCTEARTGKQVWSQRLSGKYWASPLLAGDRIYLCGEDGKTTVIAAQGEYKELAVNSLDGEFMASPAVAGKALFLRTKTHLYRLEEKKVAAAEASVGGGKE